MCNDSWSVPGAGLKDFCALDVDATYVIQWPEAECCIFIINFIRATFLCDGCVEKEKSNNLKSHSIVEDCWVLLFYNSVYNTVTTERAH